MLTVALAKGRTADDVLPLWERAGLSMPENMDESRSLSFVVTDALCGPVRFLLAKPVDVPTYVAYGVADLGVVGKDILLESNQEMYELLDFETARCQLCVAGPPELRDKRPQRVATKYPRLADAYFRGQGTAVEIVPLSGSIELAAVIGLTDRIFDLVQTGATLQANGLSVFETVYDVSARFVANRSSYQLKRAQIDVMVDAIARVVAISVAGAREGMA